MKFWSKKITMFFLIALFGLVIGFVIGRPGTTYKDKQKSLAVMLEGEDGNYSLSTLGSLNPNNNYVLNNDLSHCENGSTVTWNGTGISFIGSTQDKCTLYFDLKKSDFAITNITIDGNPATEFPASTSYTVSPICNGATATWNYALWALDITSVSSASASCSLEFITKEGPAYLNRYIIDRSYTTQGASESDGQIIRENGYRYEGKNPYNYVLFNDELWRIIGVFETTLADGTTKEDLVKIIRNESIGGYIFNSTSASYWEKTTGTKSNLNTLLNNYYYNKIDGTNSSSCYYSSTLTRTCDFSRVGLMQVYRNMAENVTWNLGGYSSATNPIDMYTYERGTTVYSSSYAKTSTGYIGLMYPSDYGYSVLSSSCARTTNLASYNTTSCAGQAWLLNEIEWTLSPDSSNSAYIWRIDNYGSMTYTSVSIAKAVRPVLYLKSQVYIISGEGTIDNPYIIGM